jgi:methionyl-tRNA synthetase
VPLDAFKRLELRTAKVTAVEEHPQADRLWVLTVDVGGTEKRVVAGIRAHYAKEALLGKTVILVNNLEPAVIRGVASSGMILASKDAAGLAVLTVDRPVAPGSPVS